ncbi:MAG: hypothetical protein OXF11_09535 [Deltaproteobacteria bacterium]|nr:hypothetical protein [Deltaproteobacteria bacterium]
MENEAVKDKGQIEGMADEMGGRVQAGVGARGNPGFVGYEYQIDVTVWLALDLLLGKAVTQEIVVEPPSNEDIEAAVSDPGRAMLDLGWRDEARHLVIQVKRRTGAPWSQSDFELVVGGPKKVSQEAGRTWPVDLLVSEGQALFVLVTNEALSAKLREFEIGGVLERGRGTKLPGKAGGHLKEGVAAEIASRMGILAGVTDEALEGRIRDLLHGCGHVPAVQKAPCVEALRREVHRRMVGEFEGTWCRDELIDVLRRFGGAVSPRREMDHYVAPRSLEQIQRTFDGRNAVVIAGPSGNGKTLTADILERTVIEADGRFQIIGAEYGPGHVRQHLADSAPVLFHLRDPWGSNRLIPGADCWGTGLPGLLSKAGPEKRFIVTTRSDVLRSAGPGLVEELAPYTVAIELQDYGPERLARIYDGFAGDLSGYARQVARSHRKTALDELSRPYEIDRFIAAVKLEDREKPRRAAEIVADSQINAISRVIARQLQPWGKDGAASAVIVWAVISARGAVPWRVVDDLVRAIRRIDGSVRPDVSGLVEFLEEGRNLRREGTVLYLHHPRVEEGLRLASMAHRSEAEHVLSLVLRALVAFDEDTQDWGVETALSVLVAASRLEGMDPELDATTQGRVDAHLTVKATKTGGRGDFERAFRELAEFGGASHMPSQLARMLTVDGTSHEGGWSGQLWHRPDVSSEHLDELARHPENAGLLGRFVREWLPFSRVDYEKGLTALVERLAPGSQEAFWDALDTVAGPGGPAENIETIVVGACAGEAPDFDRAIDRFVRSEAEARAWLEGDFADELRAAEEHEVDAVVADHVIEEPDEQFHNAEAGLEAVVRLRSAGRGLEWAVGYSDVQPVISAVAELLKRGALEPRAGEMGSLLGVATGWSRAKVWRAAMEHWDDGLLNELSSYLAKEGLEGGWREALVEVAVSQISSGETLSDFLAQAVQDAVAGRQLELVYDIATARVVALAEPRTDLRKLAERVCGRFEEELGELGRALTAVVSGEAIQAVAARFARDCAERLKAILEVAPLDVVGGLIGLAAAIGLDIVPPARRLLRSGQAEHGVHAVQGLAMAGGTAGATMREAVGHGRYVVRVAALKEVMSLDVTQDRSLVVAAARDRSADVRLEVAQAMRERTWPEAVDALVDLLLDERDFAIDYGTGAWSRFSVARAAAHALGEYDELPQHAVEGLVATVRRRSKDPFVACAAVSALAGRDGWGAPEAVSWSLETAGMADAPRHRPLAQAAAWAAFDGVVAGKAMDFGPVQMATAREDAAAIAGPLLMAIGMQGGAARTSLLADLGDVTEDGRAALVRVAAVVAQKTDGLVLEAHEKTLVELRKVETSAQLGEAEREEAESWSLGLDAEDEFERFMRWLICGVSDLPMAGEVADVRAVDVPKRIPVMTMRSLTPYRERIPPGSDDGL